MKESGVVTIRPMSKVDLLAVSQMLAETIGRDSQREPAIFVPMTNLDSNRTYLESIVDDPSFCALVAEHEASVVGYLVGYSRSVGQQADFLRKSRVFWIDDLQVRDDHKQRGVGRALVQAAARHAKESGCQRIELDVYEFNENAIAFYLRLGFVTQKRTMSSFC